MKIRTITKTSTGALDVVAEDGRQFQIDQGDEHFQVFAVWQLLGGAEGVQAINDDVAGIPQWARKRASR